MATEIVIEGDLNFGRYAKYFCVTGYGMQRIQLVGSSLLNTNNNKFANMLLFVLTVIQARYFILMLINNLWIKDKEQCSEQ